MQQDQGDVTISNESDMKGSEEIGESEFVLPVAPPSTPSKDQIYSTERDPTFPVTSKSINDSDSEKAESILTSPESCQKSPGRLLECEDSWNPDSMSGVSEKGDTERHIDDHPLVAIVLVILAVIGTAFVGFAVASTGRLFFILLLFLIYGMVIKFFLEKSARAKARNDE